MCAAPNIGVQPTNFATALASSAGDSDAAALVDFPSMRSPMRQPGDSMTESTCSGTKCNTAARFACSIDYVTVT